MTLSLSISHLIQLQSNYELLCPECLWIILNVSGMFDKASESVWGMCLECVCGFILCPECLWIILDVSGMLDKASESVWRMYLECVWNVSVPYT